ncbi:MAG: hypothetical protein H7Y42_16435 [Chitinophagaceae bacterium]|nr:hypothetical protein [Chitinophagaceae bacterium]
MTCEKWLFGIVFILIGTVSSSQKIIYSEPDKDDTRRLNFEIAGKIGGNFLIYKNIRNTSWISVLDNDMKQISRVEQDYVPDNDRMINVDFFPYGDYCYMIYQYQKRNVVYCVAAKIDGNGKKIGDVIQMDTTQLGFAASNKIYSVLSSEDKNKLIVFKINSKNRKNYMITTLLFDNQLSLLKRSRLSMPMEDRDDYLSEFQLDNDGDMVFTKFDRVNNENIGKAAFVIKYAQADSFTVKELNLEKTFLDEIHIKPDNYNKRYFLTSFYYKQRRGNTDGYYFYVWDKQTGQAIIEDTITFHDELRKEARGNSNTRMAFNDFFIRNIITRRDGGFIIGSEAYYTTSRGNAFNRWNYLYGSPFSRPMDYYSYSPYYSSYWWNSRWNDGQNVRYQADNIVVMSFDKMGKPEWTNVISKEQFDDQSDDLISYQIMNTGGQLHVLFNNMERRVQLLNDFSITPDGKINRSPTLKNLDKGYEFMPKYAKQVSARQIIVPCLYRNYICFAKIDYN